MWLRNSGEILARKYRLTWVGQCVYTCEILYIDFSTLVCFVLVLVLVLVLIYDGRSSVAKPGVVVLALALVVVLLLVLVIGTVALPSPVTFL